MTAINIVQGDIAEQRVDAIVNAANNTLLGGGGVDGAIHHLAGPALFRECESLGGCATGEAKITQGYNLPAKYVVHTVGPQYGGEDGREELLLSLCYINSLKLAQQHGIRSIAFPSISAGAFRYPKEEAAYVAINTVKYFVERHPNAFDEIRFVLFNEDNYSMYDQIMAQPEQATVVRDR